MKIKGFGIPPDDDIAGRPFGESVTLQGSGVSSGITIGPLYVVERGGGSVPEYLVKESAIDDEVSRFEKAVAHAVQQLKELIDDITAKDNPVADELTELLEAHIHMLQGSRLVRDAEARIRDHRLNAEAAVQAAVKSIAKLYAEIKDTYLAARVHDVEDVGARVIRNLSDAHIPSFTNLPDTSIIVAEEITPADIALMDPAHIGGIVAAVGGRQDHTSIMARSLGLPAILGVVGVTEEVSTGQLAILDGNAGRLILNPTTVEVAEYRRRIDEAEKEVQDLKRLARLPSTTRDGTSITLKANTELPAEIELANANGAEGVGLVRTEFLYLGRKDLPTEEEQYQTLARIVTAMDGKPVTVRTLDIGGDKLGGVFASQGEEGANPALGLRAIRFSLLNRDMFRMQIAAILRAGALGPVNFLLPMITNVQEVKVVRQMVEEVAADLTARKVAVADPLPQIGVMIEVPAAALAAEHLAKEADFFSIGTNDLVMYTLAIDRSDERVAPFYDTFSPSVWRLVKLSIDAAKEGGIGLSVCGEMAGDEAFAALLIGMGVRELSMNAASLSRVKRRIRSLDLIAAERFAAAVLEQSDSKRIAMIMQDFNELAQ